MTKKQKQTASLVNELAASGLTNGAIYERIVSLLPSRRWGIVFQMVLDRRA